MFAFPNKELSPGVATDLLAPFQIQTFHEAVLWIWKLPYGRTSDRSNYLLVPVEGKGACSAKHAYLAQVAIEQKIPIDLCVGIFMMSYDFTTFEESENPHPRLDFVYEEIISPDQIGDYKVNLHQKWMKQWIETSRQSLGFERIWQLRETCIASLYGTIR